MCKVCKPRKEVLKLALNDNQNNFIELYLQGLNPTEISKQMHISRTMIYKYLKNDEIKVVN